MTSTASISVRSPAFAEGQPIPRRYTCDGDNVSPPLNWTGLPAGTGSVAVCKTGSPTMTMGLTAMVGKLNEPTRGRS